MRSPFTHRFSYALALSIGLLAPGVRADTPSRPYVAPTAVPIDPAKHAEWLRLGQTARERALHGDYAGATELYKKALELEKSSEVLFALGMSEARADHHLDAVIDLRRYIDEPDAEPSKIALAKSLLPKLSEGLGHINIDDSPLAETFIDGTPLRGTRREPDPSGDTYIEFVDVEPGAHEFTASAPGKRWHSSVTVKAGETVTAVFKEEAVPVPPAVATEPVASTVAAPKPDPLFLARKSARSKARVQAFFATTGMQFAGYGLAALGTELFCDAAILNKQPKPVLEVGGGALMLAGLASVIAAGFVGQKIEDAAERPQDAHVSLTPVIEHNAGALLLHGTF